LKSSLPPFNAHYKLSSNLIDSNHHSSVCSVSSGVPQGSVLGPLLFNLFINDISDNFQNVSAKLFADDIKLYSELCHPAAVTNFQAHLDLICSWASTWQVGISHNKCVILELGRHTSNEKFSIQDRPIVSSSLVKDLGVYVDSDLSFASHIHDFVKRSKSRASLIFRCFLTKDLTNLKRAFITYVRPLLEYASPVWSPSHLYLIHEIEGVQRSFTKRLPGLGNLTYAERLSKLGLQSLEHRRLIADLMFCFKIVRGYSSLDVNQFFKFSNNPYHKYRINIPLAKTNVRRFFLSYRILNTWNSLPSPVIAADNPFQFKKMITQLDLSKYLQSG
jgi:hypothetical protein